MEEVLPIKFDDDLISTLVNIKPPKVINNFANEICNCHKYLTDNFSPRYDLIDIDKTSNQISKISKWIPNWVGATIYFSN